MTYRKPPFLLRKWQRLQMRYYAYRNPEKLVRIRYRQRFGTDPDLENPRTFNEKVLWMMLHADTTRWSQLADKYRVREYVEQCGLGWMLNELYGVWESAEEIDFSGRGNLPDTFVLKTNNGYGQVIIVNDRQKADIRSIRRTLNHTLRKKFGRMTAEHHYFGIKPRIIAERLLPSEPAFGNSLIDYKFYCFDGNPYCCMVCYNRKSPSDVKTGLYDARTWKNIGHYVTGKYYDPHQCDIPRPASLDRMLDAAKRLSSGFPKYGSTFTKSPETPYSGTDIHLICRYGYGIQPGVSGIDGIANLPAARQADATVAPGTARAPRTAEGRRQIKTAGSPEGRVQQAARPARHSPLPGYGERAVIL
ncbi:MAG: ATP-grasp fold amidoligase family protein [Alistipes sp.]